MNKVKSVDQLGKHLQTQFAIKNNIKNFQLKQKFLHGQKTQLLTNTNISPMKLKETPRFLKQASFYKNLKEKARKN